MDTPELNNRLKELGVNVTALLNGVEPSANLVRTYASRKQPLSVQHRRNVAAVLRRLSGELQGLACELAEEGSDAT